MQMSLILIMLPPLNEYLTGALARLSAHLIELERETGAACPNPKWLLEHANAILRLIDEMSTTRGGSHAAR